MPIRTNRVTHIAGLAATLLAATAFFILPSSMSPAVAEEEDHSAHPQPKAEAPAGDAEHGGHSGMMGKGMQGGMQMQGGMHERGMQGCKMMGDDHAGMMGGGGMQMQGGMHEGGMQGCKMMGGDHAGTMGGEHAGTMAKKPGMMSAEVREMMHEMMLAMTSHVDERLAAVRSDLAITDAQLPQWNAFADAVRSAARSMEQAHKEMMASEAAAPSPMAKPVPAPEPTLGGARSYPGMDAVKKIEPSARPPEKPAGSLPAKLEAHDKMLTRHLDSLKAIEAALDPLYATFDDKQKATADSLKIGPMGLM